MKKKIAILAILISIFIAGNLLASPADPLYIYVYAQDEVDWTLKIWDGIASPYWKIEEFGNYTVDATDCQDDYYEMWALEETIFIESGNLPYANWYEIEVTVTVPSEEDPEQ